MNCYRCGDKFNSKTRIVNHLKQCKQNKLSKRRKKNNNTKSCFICNKKMLTKFGGSKLFLPDYIGNENFFYKCLDCSIFNPKNLQKERHFFNTYKKGKYTHEYDKAVRVPIVSSRGLVSVI